MLTRPNVILAIAVFLVCDVPFAWNIPHGCVLRRIRFAANACRVFYFLLLLQQTRSSECPAACYGFQCDGTIGRGLFQGETTTNAPWWSRPLGGRVNCRCFFVLALPNF